MKEINKIQKKYRSGKEKRLANLQPGHGRSKGSKNKFTNLKKAFLDTFEKIEKEGKEKDAKIKTLFEWATKNDKNQGMFYQMIAKMLPTSITGGEDDEGRPVPIKLIIENADTNARKS